VKNEAIRIEKLDLEKKIIDIYGVMAADELESQALQREKEKSEKIIG